MIVDHYDDSILSQFGREHCWHSDHVLAAYAALVKVSGTAGNGTHADICKGGCMKSVCTAGRNVVLGLPAATDAQSRSDWPAKPSFSSLVRH